MLRLFGYCDEYEFHGPLELILGYIDFYELESKLVYVCKDFYLASKCSYLGRKIEYWKIYEILYKRKGDKSFDEYMVKIYQYKCIRIDNYIFIRCASKGLIKIITILLENEKENIDPSYRSNFPIREASKYGNTSVVKLLMSDSRVDPSAMDNYAIRQASKNGHEDVVRLLMSDSRVNPSALGNEAIRMASATGNISVVKILMSDSRVNPSDLDNEAIIDASFNGYINIVKLLMTDARVNPMDQDNQAIKDAIENDHKDVVKLLQSYRK